MKHFVLASMVSCLVLGIFGPRAVAQTFPYDHIHLNAPDAAAAANWYEKYFGGRRITEAPDRLMYGSTRLLFLKKDDAKPSNGSAIDQLSFSFPNVDAKLQEFKAAEDKYLLYVNKREEARISDALDQGGILNVAIAEPPAVPALPARSELSFAFIGLALASTCSTALAFVADYLNPAFRTPDEVMAYLNIPVLASLPQQRI